jgi:hypothetical protein
MAAERGVTEEALAEQVLGTMLDQAGRSTAEIEDLLDRIPGAWASVDRGLADVGAQGSALWPSQN